MNSRVISLLFIIFLTGVDNANAQSNSMRAKAYYIEAEKHFELKKYEEALNSLVNVEEVLGSSNARVLGLKVKVLYKLGKYYEAREALSQFSKYKASSSLQSEITPYVLKVDKKISEIEEEIKRKKQKQKQEDKAWQQALSQNNEYSYKKYLRNYPYGKYKSKAKNKLEEILWKKTKNINTIEAYLNYIAKTPTGAHISEAKENSIYTDPRDGQTYECVVIGNQIWMAENLNYDAGSGSWCYNDNSQNCNQYGRLYNWETAKRACPDGWHLPSKREFETLLDNVGSSMHQRYLALKKDGSSGFSAFFGGGRSNASRSDANPFGEGMVGSIANSFVGDNFFGSLGKKGNYWSSSEVSSGHPWYLSINSEDGKAGITLMVDNWGFSVRCLQD